MNYPEFERRIQLRVRELENAGMRRHLAPPCGLDLSSNDYLGLTKHPLLQQRMADAVWTEGCGSTASRLLRGNRQCFSDVERRFAAFKNAEAALFMGSGYAANLSVLGTFIERNDLVLSDDRNHASIIDGIRLAHAKRTKFPHCNVDRVASLLREAPAGRAKFLVTESLFSMDGDFAPLADYAQLCRETGAALIVDEAHAVGIYGERGSGLVEQTGTSDGVFVTVNTAGKAMGVSGAFVAGPSWAIDYLIQRARPFIFSTAPPPPIAAALDASLTVIEQEPERRERLLKQATLLRRLLDECGIDTGRSHSQIIPILLGENDRASVVAAGLQVEGFDVRAIRPPTVPPGTARLRISVNASVEESELRRFAESLNRIMKGADRHPSSVNPCSMVYL